MEVDILRIDKDKKENLKDTVTDEAPLTLELEGKELVTLLCSPDNLKELSIGFLYSSGLVNSLNDIENIVIDNRNLVSHLELKNKDILSELVFKRLYTSGCGKGVFFYNALDLMHRKTKTGNFQISAGKITELMQTFQKSSLAFRKTGGVHSAALSNGKEIIIFKEDIGRHNALDKVIGTALIKNLKMKDLIVLTSGRITSEIVFKVRKIGSPILISRSAPTDQAIKVAGEGNLTLAGFVRGQRMNVYTVKERVI
ncbi:MAG: formate dehydrogenase accessory sulfurtransferase FdhD [Nitrospirae bacterium]|nr:formate dehydrogenase accessory sulfurtransferase FdhD [Nitrospirota bacterium]